MIERAFLPTFAWILAAMMTVAFCENTYKEQCLTLIERKLFASAIIECSNAICTD